jgi:hypothetical protein bfra3_14167
MLMLFASVTGTVAAWFMGDVVHVAGNSGFGLPSANEWISDNALSLAVSLGLNIVISFLLLYINRRFNIIRSVSMLFAGMFLVMQAGQPSLMGQLYDGSVMCFLILLAIIPFFSTFQRPDRTRRIFLSFFLISFGSLTGYAYAVYLIVFLIGCFQMQCLTFKGLLAAATGIFTPYWILWGFGIISLSSFRMPEFINIFDALEGHDLAQIVVYTSVNLILGVGFGIFNMIKIYSYNGRARAYNGFWIILTIITTLFVVIDYTNLIIYLPILNCCTAIQIGHFFTINNTRRTYIPICCIYVIYIALYIWSITL